MPSNVPAPAKLVKQFLKSIAAFMKKVDVEENKAQALILGIGEATLRDWKSGRRSPTVQTVERVSNDMAVIERYLAVCSCDR